MAYPFPNYQQPFQYQDQLSQLRSMPMTMPGQSYQMPARQDNGLNWVQGEAGAKSWFVNPGATVLLMDSESQRFYLKSADPNGVPQMRTFEYAEIGAQAPAEPQKYLTVDEFAGFKKEVLGKLEELSAPVEVSLSRKKKGEVNE